MTWTCKKREAYSSASSLAEKTKTKSALEIFTYQTDVLSQFWGVWVLGWISLSVFRLSPCFPCSLCILAAASPISSVQLQLLASSHTCTKFLILFLLLVQRQSLLHKYLCKNSSWSFCACSLHPCLSLRLYVLDSPFDFSLSVFLFLSK